MYRTGNCVKRNIRIRIRNLIKIRGKFRDPNPTTMYPYLDTSAFKQRPDYATYISLGEKKLTELLETDDGNRTVKTYLRTGPRQ